MPEPENEGWPCHFSEEVGDLLADPQTSPELFSAVAALSVEINETRGQVTRATRNERWPQQRRVPLGRDGILGVAEYVIMADVEEPYCIITRVQPY